MARLSRRRLGASGTALALAAMSRGRATEGWPGRPVSLVVPFAPGGSADVIGRPLANYLTETFGQPFVIDNRAGANGNVGTQAAARAVPDGQTLLVTTNGPVTTNTLLFRAVPYDPFADLTPIALLADLPVVIVARRDAPFGSLVEMIARAKARPGAVDCGVPATGALGHLAAELFQRRAGISLTLVPFRGSASLTNALLSGTVALSFDLVTSNIAHIQAGTLRVLGVASAERLDTVPGAEPIAAQGIPDFEATGWTAVLGPPGLPPGIVQRVNAAANGFLAKPEILAMLGAIGSRALGGSPADLRRRMAAEVVLWRPVIAAAGISLD